jgi:hypothetical protein
MEESEPAAMTGGGIAAALEPALSDTKEVRDVERTSA